MEKKKNRAGMLVLGITAGAIVGAAAYGAYKLWQFSQDEYAQELRFPAKGPGLRVRKVGPANAFIVDCGVFSDEVVPAGEPVSEPELELELGDVTEPEPEVVEEAEAVEEPAAEESEAEAAVDET